MRQRGAALIIVLWLLVLLIGIVGAFAINAHSEALQARGARVQLQLQQAADAGIEAAVVALLATDPAQRPVPDGRAVALPFQGMTVTVAITDETAKVDLNVADAALLQRLFEALGEPRAPAQALAAAIIDWRDGDVLVSPGGAEADAYRDADLDYGPANQPFTRVSELQRVLGMTAARLARVRPYLTVHTGQAQPNAVFAAEPVLFALGLDPRVVATLVQARAQWDPRLPAPALPGGLVLSAAGSGTYSISSRAERADGPMAEVQATVRLGAGGFLGQVYTPLVWHSGNQD